ncbi:MAG: energy transducer TonB [Pseudomonadota bacterium]
MRNALEICAFVAVALVCHVLAFAPGPKSGSASGGSGGDAIVSVAAAAPTVVEMVRNWEMPPKLDVDIPNPLTVPQAVSQTVPAVPHLELENAPRAPVQVALSMPQDLDEVALDPPAPPPPPPPEPEAAADPLPDTRPRPRPKTPEPDTARKADKTSAGQAKQTSAGSGGTSQAGAGAAKVATGSPGQTAQLQALWGAKIQARIERNKRYPRGTDESGIVTVELMVSRNGQLLNYRIVRSSGTTVLDQAAMGAVSRAKRFPKAPKALAGDSFRFRVKMQLSRR